MRKLSIDGVPVVINRIERCPDHSGLIRVFVDDRKTGQPWSQHDIPHKGKFRTSGHLYEWSGVVGPEGFINV